VKITHRKLA